MSSLVYANNIYTMEQPNTPQDQPSAAPQEESIFQESDYSMEGYDKHIRTARNILFFLAGIQALGFFSIRDEEGIVLYISIGVIILFMLLFVGLALWTKKKPFTALLIALILYVSLLITDAIIDPTDLYKGLILKIGIIVSLIAGLRNAKEAQDLRKAFGKE
jgi:hypothetical protein